MLINDTEEKGVIRWSSWLQSTIYIPVCVNVVWKQDRREVLLEQYFDSLKYVPTSFC
jgi:hypothetical protein